MDLFVNYDCDLQAANIYERTLRGISRAVRRQEATGVFGSVQYLGSAKERDAAVSALVGVLKSLHTWAEPLKVLSFNTCWALISI